MEKTHFLIDSMSGFHNERLNNLLLEIGNPEIFFNNLFSDFLTKENSHEYCFIASDWAKTRYEKVKKIVESPYPHKIGQLCFVPCVEIFSKQEFIFVVDEKKQEYYPIAKTKKAVWEFLREKFPLKIPTMFF